MATKRRATEIEECEQRIEELKENKAGHQEVIKSYQERIAYWQAELKSSTDERRRRGYESAVLLNESRLQWAKQQQASRDHALQVQQSQLAQLEQAEQHEAAYKKAIKEKYTVKIRAVRINYVGLPRSGKTCTRLRLLGKLFNIKLAKLEGLYREGEHPSTGVAEDGGQISAHLNRHITPAGVTNQKALTQPCLLMTTLITPHTTLMSSTPSVADPNFTS